MVATAPFQALVVVLFLSTNGANQLDTGLSAESCVGLQQIPQGLDPPPPDQSNYANVCSSSLFGLKTARWLDVGRSTQDGIVKRTISQSYRLGADGQARIASSLDWLVDTVFVIYLIAMEWRFGATLSKRLLDIRVVDRKDPERVGIPIHKAIIRFIAMWIAVAPVLAVLQLPAFMTGLAGPEQSAAILAGAFWKAMFNIAFFTTAVFGILWGLWVVIDIARKRDPFYDRIANTAVLRKTPSRQRSLRCLRCVGPSAPQASALALSASTGQAT